jgi:hypothetical protein
MISPEEGAFRKFYVERALIRTQALGYGPTQQDLG